MSRAGSPFATTGCLDLLESALPLLVRLTVITFRPTPKSLSLKTLNELTFRRHQQRFRQLRLLVTDTLSSQRVPVSHCPLH